jgi:hypothetical protein
MFNSFCAELVQLSFSSLALPNATVEVYAGAKNNAKTPLLRLTASNSAMLPPVNLANVAQ